MSAADNLTYNVQNRVGPMPALVRIWRGHFTMSALPRKRTLIGGSCMCALCQKVVAPQCCGCTLISGQRVIDVGLRRKTSASARGGLPSLASRRRDVAPGQLHRARSSPSGRGWSPSTALTTTLRAVSAQQFLITELDLSNFRMVQSKPLEVVLHRNLNKNPVIIPRQELR